METNQKDNTAFQSLGFFGICKNSIKIISKQPRTFLLLTATLTVPQALLALIHDELALFTLRTITAVQLALVKTPSVNAFRTNQEQLSLYSLLDFVTLLVYSVLCIFSVSTVTYTAALVHYRITPAGDQISFKKVMRIIHTVWKSVVGTALWIFLVVIVSGFILGLILLIFFGLSNSGNSNGAYSVFIAGAVILILYWVALVYFMIIASLALVISVVETGSHGCGYQSLVKGKALLKGNVGKAIAIYFIFNICTALVRSMIDEIIASLHDSSVFGMIGMVGLGSLGFLVMVFLLLYWYVLQTVLYAACKFYHGESIDNATILYLESTAAYTPLIGTAEDTNEQV